MSSPATQTAPSPARPVRTHNDPLGKVGWLTGAGVALALSVLTALVIASRPVRNALAVLRDGGAVAATAPAESSPALASPDARRRAVTQVRAELVPIYRANRASLDRVIQRTRGSDLPQGIERLQTWARLREAWARALARTGLSPADYRVAAAKAPPGGPDASDLRALDALLGVESASPAVTPPARP